MAQTLSQDFVVGSVADNIRSILKTQLKRKIYEGLDKEVDEMVEEGVRQMIDNFTVAQQYSPITDTYSINVFIRKKG